MRCCAGVGGDDLHIAAAAARAEAAFSHSWVKRWISVSSGSVGAPVDEEGERSARVDRLELVGVTDEQELRARRWRRCG